jgi:hypothetical protein
VSLTTVTRFPDTTISVIPGIAYSASASGEPAASSRDAKRRNPVCTGWSIRNLQRC